ncbi:hypothetical protein [Schaalia vaccimaxillae]|uniref:hypothetical protein n=1 Tax=Schaalia vaccimaxillae TaxID=183916 RepID=UPI0003B56664|nr:hypothetical protein [Schaalia vaccimaxillae]
MRSKMRRSADELLPFGAPAAGSGAAQMGGASASYEHKQVRSKKALRPLLWSLPVLVLILGVAAYLIALPLWSKSSLGHWDDGDVASAQSDYVGQAQATSIGIEKWVAEYNLGTTKLYEHKVDEGVQLLRGAWDLVPKAMELYDGRIETYSYECQVRINLALGIEAQGDQLMADEEWAQAQASYDEAMGIVSPCQTAGQADQQDQDESGADQNQSGGSSESDSESSDGESSDSDSGQQNSSDQDSGEQADESTNRLGNKSREAGNKAEGNGSGGSGQQGSKEDQNESSSGEEQADESQAGRQGSQGDSGGTAGSQPPGENGFEGETPSQKRRREELQKKLQQGADDQNRSYDESRTGNPNGAW